MCLGCLGFYVPKLFAETWDTWDLGPGINGTPGTWDTCYTWDLGPWDLDTWDLGHMGHGTLQAHAS